MSGSLLTETDVSKTDVSKQLRVSLACLRRWRLERRGPMFVKMGQLVRYRPEDLESWLKTLPTGGLVPDRRQPVAEPQSAALPRRASA
jgi:hypothetical protein